MQKLLLKKRTDNASLLIDTQEINRIFLNELKKANAKNDLPYNAQESDK